MKTYLLKRFFLCALFSVCVFSGTHPALSHGKHADASGETVTAKEASKSRDALREFVLHAKAHWEIPVTPEKSLDLWHKILYEIQHKGDWKSGSSYLILVDKQGRAIAHGYYESAHGRDLSFLRDDRGTDVVGKLIKAAKSGKKGGFVDYYWDDPNNPSDHETLPKTAYATNYTVRALGIDLVLIGGFHHKEQILSMSEVMDEYVPEVKARSVKDKGTLKNFVEKTVEFVDHVYKTTRGNMDIAELLKASSDKKAWKHNEIYLFTVTNQGLVVFNGNNPDMKETYTINVKDKDGVDIAEEIIKNAERGGFVHYRWDNPSVKGDEITEVGKASGTSPKISYVKQIKLGDDHYIIGSGIYPPKESKYVKAMDTEDNILYTINTIIIICLVILLGLLAIWMIRGKRKKKG